MKLIKKALAVLAAIGLTVSPLGNQSIHAQDKVSVIASFYPMYEFAHIVGGDRVEVTQMVANNDSPHGYEPSAQDIIRVNEADAFIYSSDSMEHWVESLLTNVDNLDLKVVQAGAQEGHEHIEAADHDHDEAADHDHEISEATENGLTIIGLQDHYHTGNVITLKVEELPEGVSRWQWEVQEEGSDWKVVEDQGESTLEYEATDGTIHIKVSALDESGKVLAHSQEVIATLDNHEDMDPHSWLDPVSVQGQVGLIRDALIELDPEGEAEYTANAQAFIEELQQLDKDFQVAFEGASQRAFVVQHEAFGYLAKRYNLEQISVGGLSTEVDPSPARIGEITKTIKELGVPVIYFQQGSNSAIAQTIAAEAGTEVAELYDLESLSDELLSQGLGYIDAMRANLEALKLSIK